MRRECRASVSVRELLSGRPEINWAPHCPGRLLHYGIQDTCQVRSYIAQPVHTCGTAGTHLHTSHDALGYPRTQVEHHLTHVPSFFSELRRELSYWEIWVICRVIG